ncbi:MAG: Hpt domain-containing protein [Planctomycetaceae bacterium]
MNVKTTTRTISPERMADIRNNWPLIDGEVVEMTERWERLREAAAEQSLCGQLRRAVHDSGFQVKQVAAAVGLDPFVLCDWLEGTRSLRSEFLDRIGLAIQATVTVSVSPRDASTRQAPQAQRT